MRLKTSSSQRKVLQRTRRAVGQSCTTCTRRAVTVSSWRRVWSAVAEARGLESSHARPSEPADTIDHVSKNPSTS